MHSVPVRTDFELRALLATELFFSKFEVPSTHIIISQRIIVPSLLHMHTTECNYTSA